MWREKHFVGKGIYDGFLLRRLSGLASLPVNHRTMSGRWFMSFTTEWEHESVWLG